MEPSVDMEIAKSLITKRLHRSHLDDTQGRISLTDNEFRYAHTSWENREFYYLNDDQIIGRHLVEVIGKARFVGQFWNEPSLAKSASTTTHSIRPMASGS